MKVTNIETLPVNAKREYNSTMDLTANQLSHRLNVSMDEIYRWVMDGIVDYNLDSNHRLFFNLYQIYTIQRQYQHPSHTVDRNELQTAFNLSDAQLKHYEQTLGIVAQPTLHAQRPQYQVTDALVLRNHLRRVLVH